MLRALADENFNHDLLRGLARRQPDLDIVTVQQLGMWGAPDEEVLARAADEERVVLTHDASTVTAAAVARLVAGEPMPGAIVVIEKQAMGQTIEELWLLLTCSPDDRLEIPVSYVPL